MTNKQIKQCKELATSSADVIKNIHDKLVEVANTSNGKDLGPVIDKARKAWLAIVHLEQALVDKI